MASESSVPRWTFGRMIGGIVYHTFPSLFALGVVWPVARMSFWPSVILLVITVAADVLRLTGVSNRRMRDYLYGRFSSWLTKKLYWGVFLVFPSVAVISLIPYLLLPEACSETVNGFIAAYFPGNWAAILRTGSPCSFPHGTVILVTVTALQIIAILTFAAYSFLLAISEEDFMMLFSVKPRFKYTKNDLTEAIQQEYILKNTLYIYKGRNFNKYTIALIIISLFFLYLLSVIRNIEFNIYKYSHLMFYLVNLIGYFHYIIICLSCFYLVSMYLMLLSNKSPRVWHVKRRYLGRGLW